MVVAAATASVVLQDCEALAVSNNTRMHISVALAKMVDSFGYAKVALFCKMLLFSSVIIIGL